MPLSHGRKSPANSKGNGLWAHAIVLAAITFILSSKMIGANPPPTLLLMACNGERRLAYIGQDPQEVAEKRWFGDIQRGFLFNNHFFSIDNNNLISTDLSSNETVLVASVQDIILDGYKAWQVGHVDNKTIFFSALKYDKNVSIGKQEVRSDIYRLDRASNTIQRLDINECGRPYFSVHDERLYFTGTNGEIYEFSGDTSRSLGVKGNFPSVSPYGRKIAFSSFGIIFDTVYIHDIKTGTSTSLIKFIGPWGVDPIIRWSNDSKLISVKNKSDLREGRLYVIDTTNSNIIQKVKGGYACNWFFIE